MSSIQKITEALISQVVLADNTQLLSITGSTNNGLITLNGSAPSGTVETNLSFDGTTLLITGSGIVTGDLNVNGILAANQFYSLYNTSSILYSSGSTKFGDTQDDTHNFTGSLYITGSTIITGNITGSGLEVAGLGKIYGTPLNAQTNSYTLVLSDSGKIVTLDSGSAITVTIPPYASVPFITGSRVDVAQTGAGKATFVTGSGVTINSKSGNKSIGAQYVGVTIVKTDLNTWLLLGSLIA